MRESKFDESIWFEHQDGYRLFPWYRKSGTHGISAFWVSDGSNLIEDAEPTDSIEDLVREVFGRNRSVWLRRNVTPAKSGLYRLNERAIRGWGAMPSARGIVETALRSGGAAANAPSNQNQVALRLPPLVEEALIDAGYGVIQTDGKGWVRAQVSGSPGIVMVRADSDITLLSVREAGMTGRIGLSPVERDPPPGFASIGGAPSVAALHQALHLIHVVQARTPTRLSAALEARLAAIPATERTQEVRQRIGQSLFREALLELWQGRCALSGIALPPALLRASHAKPWAAASDDERLDPFNGLLLAVQYDALFDKGLIAFDDEGGLLVSPNLDPEVRRFIRLDGVQRLRSVVPGQLTYLHYHRSHIAAW